MDEAISEAKPAWLVAATCKIEGGSAVASASRADCCLFAVRRERTRRTARGDGVRICGGDLLRVGRNLGGYSRAQSGQNEGVEVHSEG